MGVGCDEVGICYADSNGAAEKCPIKAEAPAKRELDRSAVSEVIAEALNNGCTPEEVAYFVCQEFAGREARGDYGLADLTADDVALIEAQDPQLIARLRQLLARDAEAQPVVKDKRCQCSMTISMLGDGCRYCQPQEYIDRLHDQIEEDRAEATEAAEAIRRELAMPVKPDVDAVARIISDGMGIDTRTITDIAETICSRFGVPAGEREPADER